MNEKIITSIFITFLFNGKTSMNNINEILNINYFNCNITEIFGECENKYGKHIVISKRYCNFCENCGSFMCISCLKNDKKLCVNCGEYSGQLKNTIRICSECGKIDDISWQNSSKKLICGMALFGTINYVCR